VARGDEAPAPDRNHGPSTGAGRESEVFTGVSLADGLARAFRESIDCGETAEGVSFDDWLTERISSKHDDPTRDWRRFLNDAFRIGISRPKADLNKHVAESMLHSTGADTGRALGNHLNGDHRAQPETAFPIGAGLRTWGVPYASGPIGLLAASHIDQLIGLLSHFEIKYWGYFYWLLDFTQHSLLAIQHSWLDTFPYAAMVMEQIRQREFTSEQARSIQEQLSRWLGSSGALAASWLSYRQRERAREKCRLEDDDLAADLLAAWRSWRLSRVPPVKPPFAQAYSYAIEPGLGHGFRSRAALHIIHHWLVDIEIGRKPEPLSEESIWRHIFSPIIAPITFEHGNLYGPGILRRP
jgi:hypothetical protein